MKILWALIAGFAWTWIAFGAFWLLGAGIQVAIQLTTEHTQYAVGLGLVWFMLSACVLMVSD